MRIVLHVTSGPSAGSRTDLESGQVVRVGKSQHSDISVPHDTIMSGIHFLLDCKADGCHVSDLDSAGGIFLNGEKIVDGIAHDGDLITAGMTTFTIQMTADEPQPTEGSDDELSEKQGKSAIDACEDLELEEESESLLSEELTPQEFIKLLIEKELFFDALRVQAHVLPKREAVWWAWRCVRDTCSDQLSAHELAVLESTHRWIVEPTEENRRNVESNVEAAEYRGPACNVGLAAFWSDGSLAPPDQEEVSPGALLTGQAATAALMLAAVHSEPQKAVARYGQYLEKGQAVADGQVAVPDALMTPQNNDVASA